MCVKYSKLFCIVWLRPDPIQSSTEMIRSKAVWLCSPVPWADNSKKILSKSLTIGAIAEQRWTIDIRHTPRVTRSAANSSFYKNWKSDGIKKEFGRKGAQESWLWRTEFCPLFEKTVKKIGYYRETEDYSSRSVHRLLSSERMMRKVLGPMLWVRIVRVLLVLLRSSENSASSKIESWCAS